MLCSQAGVHVHAVRLLRLALHRQEQEKLANSRRSLFKAGTKARLFSTTTKRSPSNSESSVAEVQARLREAWGPNEAWRLDVAIKLLNDGLTPPWPETLVYLAEQSGDGLVDAISELIGAAHQNRLGEGELVLALVDEETNTWRTVRPPTGAPR